MSRTAFTDLEAYAVSRELPGCQLPAVDGASDRELDVRYISMCIAIARRFYPGEHGLVEMALLLGADITSADQVDDLELC